jgi:hypothetical protein
MAATTAAYYSYSTGPTNANCESALKFNRVDTATGTTPIPIPTTTGTKFSWHKAIGLYCVSGGGSTSASNLNVKMGSAATTGLYLWFTDFHDSTYHQATTVASADAGTQNSTPAGGGIYAASWTAMTTSNQVYDASGAALTNSAFCGKYCVVCLGVGDNYAGGAGSAIALPNIVLTYDEA